jgi:cytochrome c oxidase assembly protein subunit 15
LIPIYRSLITLSLLLTLATVVLSAYIRLAEVGIGCEPWSECYASLNPGIEKKGITVLTEDGRDMAFYGARVAHRYIASTLGLFIVVIFIMALRLGKGRATSVFVPLAILGVTVFLSLLGYYTPTRSNPLITMGNLLGGMALLGLLWWLLQRETEGASVGGETARLRPLAYLALVLVVLQIVLGGWSSANYASANCPGLLSCEGHVLNVDSLANAFNPIRQVDMDEQGKVIRPDALGLLSMSHRLFALLTAAYLAFLVRRIKSRPDLVGTAMALSIFSISQILAGISTVWFQMPLLLLSLHNALAAGLLLSSINLLHRLVPPTASPTVPPTESPPPE